MDKDLRYYFQHPWLRVIVAYLVIFCNFLLFAEDPVSHSHTGEWVSGSQEYKRIDIMKYQCSNEFLFLLTE